MPALTSATLVAPITANQTTFAIQGLTVPTGSVGFPAVGVYAIPQQPILIDSEIMYLVIQSSSGYLTVRSRGAEGTQAMAHDALANVFTGLPLDFGTPPAGAPGFFDPNLPAVVTIGSATYTVGIALGDTTFIINTVGAAAITLPAPLASMNGTIYSFTSNAASAHVITATNLINSGTGTQPKSTITFGATLGAGVELQATNGLWNIYGSNFVTIA